MKSIVSNAVRMFTRNKELFYLITVLPIFGFFLMTLLLPYSTTHNIAVVSYGNNQDSVQIVNALEELEGMKIIDVSASQVDSKLRGGNIEIAVLINEDGNIELKSLGGSEVESTVELCIRQSLSAGEIAGNDTVVNEASTKRFSIANSLGFMIFKTITSGDILAALIIMERNRKMKDRILLSGTTPGSYLGGMALTYLVFMLIGSLVYYIAASVLGIDFGMRNSLGYLAVLVSVNVLSTAFYLFLSTIFKKQESLWFLATFILTPMGLFSGIMFPYQIMPPLMKTIGSLFPQRWIARAIENIQTSGSMRSAIPDLALILGVSAVLFVAATMRSRLKGQPVTIKS